MKKKSSIMAIFAITFLMTACTFAQNKKVEPVKAKDAKVITPAKAAPVALAKAATPVAVTAPAKVAFKEPALSNEDSWTMVVVPDVQAYTERPRNHGILDIMNCWIVDNQEKLNIQQVLFTGDLVYRNDQNNITPTRQSLIAKEQWKGFSRLMERLDGRVPYVLCTGNHDYGATSAEGRNTWYNEFFPTDRNTLSRKQLVGCNRNAFGQATLETAIYEFKAPAPDKRKFLIITLQFAPTDKDLEWAKKIVNSPKYEKHIGIVLTHSYLDWEGKRIKAERYRLNKLGGNAGEGIFQKLVYPSKNIRLVVSGHIARPEKWEAGISFSTDKNHLGKTVNQMAFNTQAIGGGWHGNGGDGWLRLLEFMPDKKTVKATTFSPFFAISPSTKHLAWKKSKLDEFTFILE